MASLNVAEWTPDQVADWLSGLGAPVTGYVAGLRARRVDGARLLTLRCDDLEALGVRAIGHQELVLEALDHLRNFQYEVRRECVQQLALRVGVLAESAARALRAGAGGGDATRLDTQTLADVARCVHAIKPLVCWLERAAPLAAGAGAALLALALEAAACAMRDRFAELPARAVAASAGAAAALAQRLVRDTADPGVLQPAALDAVTLRQADRPLGFVVLPSCCGHQQVCDIRFGSPAHASGQVHEGDEIVAVGAQCVVGWGGAAVARACRGAAARRGGGGELALRLRRRGPAGLPAPSAPAARQRLRVSPLPLPLIDRCEVPAARSEAPAERAAPAGGAGPAGAGAGPAEGAPEGSARRTGSPTCSSDGSEPLSPPASPTQLHPDHTRMYPPAPRPAARRRHSVCGGSPARERRHHPAHAAPLHQFWHELQEQRWACEGGAGSAGGRDGAGLGPRDQCAACALYRRDKAVSCSTGLELGGARARPRTVLGGASRAALLRRRDERAAAPSAPAPGPDPDAGPERDRARGKLDKSHSTPAYDFGAAAEEPAGAGGPLAALPIPESPTTPTDSPTILVHSAEKADQILNFKKSSSQLGEAILLVQGRRAPDDRAELSSDGDGDRAAPLEAVNLRVLEAGVCSGEQLAARPPSPPPRPPGSVRAAPPAPPDYPVLRPVPRLSDPFEHKEYSPLKPVRACDAPAISVPLRHLTPHALRAPPAAGPAPPAPPARPCADAVTSPTSPSQPVPLSTPMPTHAATPSAGSVVRGMFPSSKSRSLKKKNSLLAKRRSVGARALAARGAASGAGAGAGGAPDAGVWQRVRAPHASHPRWARRHLLLVHNLLYAYRSPESMRADCMVQLAGWAVCAAGEVRSRAHAFKVYHTGTAFYFACADRDHMLAWIQLIHRATLLPAIAHAHGHANAAPLDVSKQFSETDYSETESDSEHTERRGERENKDKDKYMFGSLKKLTGRVARSGSHESVAGGGGGGGGAGGGGGGASLDRKYLRFFSRHRAKDDAKAAKSKQSGVPVPTEHYRSYRRVAPASPSASPAGPASPAPPAAGPAPDAARGSKRLPKPINYIHASNPNLVDFEASPWAARPGPRGAAPPAPAPAPAARPAPRNHQPDNFVGFVTLEEFMLKKQEEERRQVYTNRVLMGIERTRAEERAGAGAGGGGGAARELHERLQRIVPDVIYGELPAPAPAALLPVPVLEHLRAPAAPAPPAPDPDRGRSPKLATKPISIKGKDGYEKIVYPEDLEAECARGGSPAPPAPPAGPERWRDSLRRNDKVHSGAGGAGGAAAPLKSAPQYRPLPPPATPRHLALAADSWGVAGAAGGAAGVEAGGAAGGGSPGVSRLRLMFGARAPPAHQPEKPAAPCAQYPHLQCPPTFQPETYSLQLARARPAAPPAAPPAPPRRPAP